MFGLTWRFGLGLCFVVAIFLLVTFRERYKKLVINPSRWLGASWKRTLGVSLVLLLVAFFVIPMVEIQTNEQVGDVVNREEHPQVQISRISPLLLLAIVVPMAFVEEIVFRGCFMDFISRHSNVVVGLLLSSFLFSLYHLSDPATLLPFLPVGMTAGLFFGVAYYKGGVVGSGIVHCGYNTLIIVLPMVL